MGSARALIVALALVAGCGDDAAPPDGATGDSGPDATSDAGLVLPPPPAEPTSPALPSLTPCAAGLTEIEVGETETFTLCEPARLAGCPAGEYPFVDGCRSVGLPCPSGSFASAAGVASPIYVDPTAGPGGDGSEAAPYTTLSDALAGAASGDTLMLAAGEHLGDVEIGISVTLMGACTAGTTIVAPPGVTSGVIVSTTSEDVRLENLRLSGDGFGVRVVSGSTTLSDVVVESTRAVGVAAVSGTTTLRDVVIADTRPTGAGDLGVGLIAMNDARISAERLSLTNNFLFSAGANLGATIEMRSARISDSRPGADTGLGVALSATEGSTISCEGCALERSAGAAIEVAGAGSSVALVDSRVDDTLQSGDEDAAFAIYAREGGSISLTRSAVTRSAVAAIVLTSGATATITDVVIHDVGIDAGLVAFGRTSTMAERFAVSQATGVAIHLSDAGASARFADLMVVDCRAREADGLGGRGVEVNLLASAVLERVRIENNIEVALFVDLESTVSAADLLIANTRPRSGIGRGINVQNASTFDGERISVIDSTEVGVFVYGAGTTMTARGIRIEGTLARDCPDGSCLSGGGSGIVALDDAHFSATDFLVSDNALAGLQLVAATAEWMDGVVRGHPVGVNIQRASTDLSALMNNVIFVDNDQNLDATELPTPAPAPSATR